MPRFWVAVFLLLFVSAAQAGSVYKCKGDDGNLQYQETPCPDSKSVSSWNASPGPDGDGTQVLARGPGGHYFVDGSVNDQTLNFALDTGASYVSLPLEIAQAAGLHCQRLTSMQTANGSARACFTTIDKLTIGSFTLHYVDAVVAPGLSQPLLGMNVLKRFRLEQQGDQMRMTKNY